MRQEHILEVIVVEGRDDTAAIRRAVDADTIETHGFGMSEEMWKCIEAAAVSRGIIVFTDPDYAGEQIRRKVRERFPESKQAYLPRALAEKKGNIGVENASPEAIREALAKAHVTKSGKEPLFTFEDLAEAGLTGGPGSRDRRRKVCDILGIGYGNAAATLTRLNGYGITKEEFYGALQSGSDPGDPK